MVYLLMKKGRYLSLLFIDPTFYYIWLQFLFILMHDYLSDSGFSYSECIECRKRSAHVCIRCHYCYSCHPKIEQLEKEKKYNPVGYEYQNNYLWSTKGVDNQDQDDYTQWGKENTQTDIDMIYLNNLKLLLISTNNRLGLWWTKGTRTAATDMLL